MVNLQVHDSFIVGMESFLRAENEMGAVFLSKRRTTIEKAKTLFNRIRLSVTSKKKIRITQQKKILGLNTPTTQEKARSQRALAQYIFLNTRPDICASV